MSARDASARACLRAAIGALHVEPAPAHDAPQVRERHPRVRQARL